MLALNGTVKVRQELYLYVSVPVSVVGLLGNLTIVVVWSRQTYHPIRFLFIILAVSQSVAIIAMHTWMSFRQENRSVSNEVIFSFCLLAYVPIYFCSNAKLLLTAVHGMWLFFSHDSPFFSRKRITLAVVFLVLWCPLLRIMALINFLFKKTENEHELRLQIAFDMMGIALPRALLLVVLVVVACKRPPRQKGPVISSLAATEEGARSAVADASERRRVARRLGPAHDRARNGAMHLHAGSRRGTEDVEHESSLNKAVLVMSVISALVILPAVWKSNYRTDCDDAPQGAVVKAVLFTALMIDHSLLIVICVALFPSFRKPFRQLHSGLCSWCSKGMVTPLTQSSSPRAGRDGDLDSDGCPPAPAQQLHPPQPDGRTRGDEQILISKSAVRSKSSSHSSGSDSSSSDSDSDSSDEDASIAKRPSDLLGTEAPPTAARRRRPLRSASELPGRDGARLAEISKALTMRIRNQSM